MDTEKYHYPGEFTLDGVVFDGDTPKEDIVHIRDDLQFLEDDIVVATYPKAGRTWMRPRQNTLSHLVTLVTIEWFHFKCYLLVIIQVRFALDK